MSRILSLITTLLLIAPAAAGATPISIGALSSDSDGTTEVITDSLNNMEWLRWDVLNHLTYVETLAMIGPGGEYEGWRIAGIYEAQLFLAALLYGGSNHCDSETASTTVCNTTMSSAEMHGLLGDSYHSGPDNVAWFLSDNTYGRDVGYIRQYAGNVITRFEWGSVSDSDLFSELGHYPDIGWQLYRPNAVVSEPGSFALLALGLVGLALARRKPEN